MIGVGKAAIGLDPLFPAFAGVATPDLTFVRKGLRLVIHGKHVAIAGVELHVDRSATDALN